MYDIKVEWEVVYREFVYAVFAYYYIQFGHNTLTLQTDRQDNGPVA